MTTKKSYTKPFSELSGYKTFVTTRTQGDQQFPREDRSPVLPIRKDDDSDAHVLLSPQPFSNVPGPLGDSPKGGGGGEWAGERKLYRTLSKPGEEYGTPFTPPAKFPKRRTMTSSELGENTYREARQDLESIKNLSPGEMYEQALALKEEQGVEWDLEDEKILETLRVLLQNSFSAEEDWGTDEEEDWTEDLPEEEGLVLSYRRVQKRQKSHSKSERRKKYLAMGLLGRLLARRRAKRYRRTHRAQLALTQKINKKRNRKRLGPKVKNRTAHENLSHLDIVRLERHEV